MEGGLFIMIKNDITTDHSQADHSHADAPVDHAALGQRIRELREAREISQSTAATALEISQSTYSRIESGERPLAGDELVILADLFGVRAAAVTGLPAIRRRARFVARTGGSPSAMTTMREKLYAYLELDAYLTSQGIR
jgi:transcriptional regulator with XRE-family HTH domain